jgi:hypothetical protein
VEAFEAALVVFCTLPLLLDDDVLLLLASLLDSSSDVSAFY